MIIGSDTPAIVSGGASGLGAAVAAHLREMGAPVTILDMNADQGHAYATDIGGLFCQTDVSDATSVADAMKASIEVQGAPRIAVSCAGIAPAAKQCPAVLPMTPHCLIK